VVFALILGVPLVAAAVLAATFDRTRAVALLGLAMVAGFILWAYLDAPTTADGCSDCRELFGRWWQPSVATFLAVCGYAAWLAGTGAGMRLRRRR
jgi:hypothetical protein